MESLKRNDKFNITRLYYLAFNDRGQDLFKHGLAELTYLSDNANELSKDETSRRTRLAFFDGTPYDIINGNYYTAAKEDPVMFGFDIIIRTEESPLFSNTIQESVKNFFESDFISNNLELMSRKEIWEEFKIHFFQFFRDTLNNNSANPDNVTNSRFYYYLKKVSGLDNLIEANSGDNVKQFVDYGKDKITLTFMEDVTLRVGKMAHLYKNLYWSRINGKTLIPENLLRFDCDIIISEIRNFARVKKIIENYETSGNITSNDLLVLRDNMNRYVYTLYECQLFFDKMAHPDEIDIGGNAPEVYADYSISFIYKYSTLRMDTFDDVLNRYKSLNNAYLYPKYVSPFDRHLYNIYNEYDVALNYYDEYNNLKQDSEDKFRNNDLMNKKINSVDNTNNIQNMKENMIKNKIENTTSNIKNNLSKLKDSLYDKQINSIKDNLPNYSWLNGDSESVKIAKRLANAGIASINTMMAKRMALLNKALNGLPGFGLIVNNNILPPKNVYDSEFNSEQYIMSSLVKNSLNKFLTDSIKSLFKKQ